MFQKVQNFFLDLQQKDQETKRRWLVILTSGSMIAVVFFWAAYLSSTVKNLADSSNENPDGFFAVFKNGLSVVSEKAGSQLSQVFADVQELAKKTNSVTIQADP